MVGLVEAKKTQKKGKNASHQLKFQERGSGPNNRLLNMRYLELCGMRGSDEIAWEADTQKTSPNV
ncbi:hypothetical protein SAMN05660745_00399 [Corynebacterium glucuronolyticum]|nr:hypothetical protein CGLUCO_01215 [Corynebacterium glucuronolyticum DSM 44120]SMB77798.1 hypothetical protein SAMN05660745_00399 [Corynebacterium glucuronolyticum]